MKRRKPNVRAWALAGLAAMVQALSGCEPASSLAESPPPLHGSPLAGAGAPSPEARLFEGVVTRVLPAGGYTYLAIELDDGSDRWVATMGAGEPKGRRVRVHGFAARADFTSRRLERTFDHLVFGMVRPAAS